MLVMHTATYVVTLLAVLAVSTATETSHSSTDATVTTTKITTSTTKRSVTEELEDKYTLGDKPKDTSEEDDSDDEVDDEPLPTLKPTKASLASLMLPTKSSPASLTLPTKSSPASLTLPTKPSLSTLVLPTELMPPKQDAETFTDDWSSLPIRPTQEPNRPFGLLVIKIIEIARPKPQQANCPDSFGPLNLKQSNNNYKPIYSSTLAGDDTSSSEEQLPVTSQAIPQLRDYNSAPTYTSSYNYPNYSPFRFASNNVDRPWFNVFRGLNTFGNYN